MPIPRDSHPSIYASRVFPRHRLDVRARLEAVHSTGERVNIQARTRDISRSGAGLTLTHELPVGTDVLFCLRVHGSGSQLCLESTITRRTGFRVGLRFLRLTAEQRLLLFELCCD
jgi:hypothetical protein